MPVETRNMKKQGKKATSASTTTTTTTTPSVDEEALHVAEAESRDWNAYWLETPTYGKLVDGQYILFADPAHSVRMNMNNYNGPMYIVSKTLENGMVVFSTDKSFKI